METTIMNASCSECGSILPPDSPRGICPKCLMAAAFEATQVPVQNDAATASTLLRKLRYFGDYELQEEIARGGMGVVYKARQVTLNRTVAVKMILAGQLARDADIQRFLTEAEAAANLQHPNIVAIHEIGQHDGQYYFSMDYVEGQNLADSLAKNPVSPRKAAELLKEIAEAVQYAHQRGTLHRDLKPQNILMDPSGRPRITDFGLAKCTEKESGLTVSGAILGSPAYMSPEQARGHVAEIGAGSDVYSLGAILYQLLTGKPPFAGQTAVETIRMVIENDAAAPSRINPKTPADLETICLKCLEKNPSRRYFSARELAEDLERFLNHEPILARPAGAIVRFWSWCRRNPWVLTGAATVLVVGLLGFAYGLWERVNFVQHKFGKATSAQAHVNPKTDEILAAIGLTLFAFLEGSVVFCWLFMRNRRKRGLPLRTGYLVFHGLIGLIVFCCSLAVGRTAIHDWVWQVEALGKSAHFMLGGSLVFSALVAWAGVHLLTQAFQQHRSFVSGTEQPAPTLFVEEFAISGRQFVVSIVILYPLIWFLVHLWAGDSWEGADVKSAVRGVCAAMAILISNLPWLYLAARFSRGQARVFFSVAFAIIFLTTMFQGAMFPLSDFFGSAAIGLAGGLGIAVAARFRPRNSPVKNAVGSLREVIAWDRKRYLLGFLLALLAIILCWKLGPALTLPTKDGYIPTLVIANMIFASFYLPFRIWRRQAPLAATFLYTAGFVFISGLPFMISANESFQYISGTWTSVGIGWLAGYALCRFARVRIKDAVYS